MKKHHLITLIFLSITSITFGQKFDLILTKTTGHTPRSYSSKPVTDEDSSNLIIPSNIKFKFFNRYYTYLAPMEQVFRQYKSGQINYQTFLSRLRIYTNHYVDTALFAESIKKFPSSKIHFISGIDENDNKVILADADQNGVITQDEIFTFSPDTLQKISGAADNYLPNLVLKQKGNDGSLRELNITIVPLPYFDKYPDDKKKATSFYLRRNEHWEGNKQILNEPYIFYFESKPFVNEILLMQYKVGYNDKLSNKIYDVEDEYTNDKITLVVDSLHSLNSNQIKAFCSYQSPPVKHNDTTFSMTIRNVESGNDETLKSYLKKDKYILLDYWGTWCGPCIEKIPHLKKIQETYSGKLNLVSIAYDYDIKTVQSFDTKNNITWHSYYIDRNDPKQKLVKALDVLVYPTFRLYDATGKLIFSGNNDTDLDKIALILSK